MEQNFNNLKQFLDAIKHGVFGLIKFHSIKTILKYIVQAVINLTLLL